LIMSQTTIALQRVSSGYYNFQVLKDVTLQIRDGEFFGVIGPNGSGKSTLLKTASRTLKPTAGTVFYKSQNIYNMRPAEIARDFAFVAQDIAFGLSFTAWEVVMMGRIPYVGRLQRETAGDLEVVQESMRLTDTLRLANREVQELSAGERQMVIIAKALAQEPKVLFLDEPTSHLDIGHQVEILNLIKRLNQDKGITVIIVLHDLNLASEYCDRLALLKEGSLFGIGRPQGILTYQNVEEVYKTLVLVHRNPVSGNPHVLLIPKQNVKKGEFDAKG